MYVVNEARGISSLIPNVLRPVVHEQLNGDYSLTFEVAKEHDNTVFWERGDIIYANTPKGEEMFYVDEIVKTGENIETHCLQKSFLLQYKLHDDLGMIYTTGDAIRSLNSNMLDDDTDIVINYKGIMQQINKHYEKDSVYNTLVNGNESILSLTGTRLMRHRNLVELSDRSGRDTGLIIHDKRNIKDVNFKDDESIITKLYLSTTVNEWEVLPSKEGVKDDEERPFLGGIFTPPPEQRGSVQFRVTNYHTGQWVEDSAVQLRVIDTDGNMVINNAQTGSHKAIELRQDRINKAQAHVDKLQETHDKAFDKWEEETNEKTKKKLREKAVETHDKLLDAERELREVSSQEIILGKRYFDSFKTGTYYAQIVKAPTGYIANKEPVKFTVTRSGFVNVDLYLYPDNDEYKGQDKLYRNAIVESPLINYYPHVRAMFLNVDNPNIITEEDLANFGKEIFEKDRIDLPEPSMTFDITSEFADIGDWSQKFYIGDKAYVNYSDYDIRDTVELVEYEFDPLRDKYISLTFGKPEHSSTGFGRGTSSGSSSGDDKFFRDLENRMMDKFSDAYQMYLEYAEKFTKQFYDEYDTHIEFINRELDKSISMGHQFQLDLLDEITDSRERAEEEINLALKPTYDKIEELEHLTKELPPIDFDNIDDNTQRWIDELISAGNISTDSIKDIEETINKALKPLQDEMGNIKFDTNLHGNIINTLNEQIKGLIASSDDWKDFDIEEQFDLLIDPIIEQIKKDIEFSNEYTYTQVNLLNNVANQLRKDLKDLEITVEKDFGIKIKPFEQKLSVMEQRADGFDLMIKNIQEELSAGIEVGYDYLNAYVRSDEFTSSFQMNDRLVKIIADGIDLSGLVKFSELKEDNSYVKDGKVYNTYIHGGNIISGTITADRIKAKTITGEEIAGETITGDKIAGETIVAGHLDGGIITSDHITTDGLDVGVIKGLKAHIEKISTSVITAEYINTLELNAIDITGGSISSVIMDAVDVYGGRLISKDPTATNYFRRYWESYFDLNSGAIGIGLRGYYVDNPYDIADNIGTHELQIHNFQIIPHSDGTNRQNVDVTGGIRIYTVDRENGESDRKRLDIYGNSIEFFDTSGGRRTRIRGGYRSGSVFQVLAWEYDYDSRKYEYKAMFHAGYWERWRFFFDGNVYINGELRIASHVRYGGNLKGAGRDDYETWEFDSNQNEAYLEVRDSRKPKAVP